MLGKKPLKTAEDEMRRPQTPRLLPLPKPSVGVFDEPSMLIKVNVEWWSHVSGMIDVLSALDAWTGDIDEKTSAIRQIASLLSTDWSEMFVQDIRINTEDYDNPTLEKRINGVWSMVANWPDLLSLIGDAYSLASAAFEYGLAATEENADQDIAIAALDDRVNYLEFEMENQIVRINGLEDRTDELDDRLDILEPIVADHETRIAALEAWDASEQVWSETFDFKVSDYGFIGNDYLPDEGFLFASGHPEIINTSVTIYDNRITYLELHWRKISGSSGFVNAASQFPNGFNSQVQRLPQNIDDTSVQWMQVNPPNTQYSPNLEVLIVGAHGYALEKMVIWGRGDNPF